ncbi:ly6/PLAUR domain-containing protein 6B-like [Planococcus citri]|uniref:ly6/PLAUR domain-containing protein 6B-like n=1 Tax=Planococcus citri TaxID=170843 RepID=UPI0031F8F260
MVNGPCGLIISWVFVIQSIKNLTLAIHIKDNETELPLICYTCVNVSDNYICNQYAIDVPCPKGNDFCHTLHIMDSTGASVVVNKKCANSSECWSLGVGCLKVDTQTICVSCCDEIYCNVTVPTNQSDAILSNKRATHKSKQKPVVNSSAIQSIGAMFSIFIPMLRMFFW